MDFKWTLEETLAERFNDMDEARDVSNYGLAGGFSGFIYHTEINEFFDRFEDEIQEYMYDMNGDGWLVEIANKSSNIQDMITTVVYIMVESWCSTRLAVADEIIEEANAMEFAA